MERESCSVWSLSLFSVQAGRKKKTETVKERKEKKVSRNLTTRPGSPSDQERHEDLGEELLLRKTMLGDEEEENDKEEVREANSEEEKDKEEVKV